MSERADDQLAPRLGPVVLAGWTIFMALVGLAAWFVYVLIATPIFADCPNTPQSVRDSGFYFGGTWSGGASSGGSLATAFSVAAVLWLACCVTAWRLRRRLARLFVGFVALYIVALAVLWEVSPLVWGARQCVP